MIQLQLQSIVAGQSLQLESAGAGERQSLTLITRRPTLLDKPAGNSRAGNGVIFGEVIVVVVEGKRGSMRCDSYTHHVINCIFLPVKPIVLLCFFLYKVTTDSPAPFIAQQFRIINVVH